MNNRKRQIIQACIKLFSEKGFVETSIQDILDEAKISKGTFYNYFPSKKDCLIAILDIGAKETTVRKVTALTGKERNDKSVLATQLFASMQVNKENNLLPIFESILHSGDKDLKKLVDQIFMQEIDWTARRLIDVYGMTLVPYHYDAAILLFGMIHQFLHVRKFMGLPKDNPTPIVEFAIRQLDHVIPNLIAEKKTMIGPEFETYISTHIEQKEISKSDLVEQLSGFKSFIQDLNEQQAEFIHYLLNELAKDAPQYHILGAVAYQFYNAFRDTQHAAEAIEITNHIWQLIKQHKN